MRILGFDVGSFDYNNRRGVEVALLGLSVFVGSSRNWWVVLWMYCDWNYHSWELMAWSRRRR